MNHHPTAIIIGAGVAGLASAIRLASQGFAIKVFEKNERAGGKISFFTDKDYCFDGGPSLFTQPQNIEELFRLANEPIEDYFQYHSIPVACKYFYEDGIVINGFADAEQLAKELSEKTGEEENEVVRYIARSKKLYETTGSIFLNYSLHKRSTLRKAPILKALLHTAPRYLFSSFNTINKSSFRNARTVQLFNRYATYNGSNPYKAPGMLSVIPHLEYNEGVYYPKGGMISIADALYQLAVKKGVHFYFNTLVQRIIAPNAEAKGVVVNGENHIADVVISNMDVYFTYKHLLNDNYRAKNILKQERSSSAFIFYWGISKTFPQLELHNIFFSAGYKEEFNAIFATKILYHDPTIYINITSKCEPGIHAPHGKENWFVMVNAPANAGQYTEQWQAELKKNIISKLNRILHADIEPLIETERMLDPVIIESQTSSYMGSLYGTSSNSRMAAFLRHPNFSKAISRLYFVGGSVHPGGGIPLCLASAKIMSGMVKEDKRNGMVRIKQPLLQKFSLFIVLLFHVSGAIGILFSPYRDWFIQNTPLNLLIMTALIFITQKKKNSAFFFFFFIAYIVGFIVEIVGVNSGLLFGHYQYGDVLGMKYFNVPLLIGVNWFIIIYCAGIIATKLYNWSNRKLAEADAQIKPLVQFFSFIIDGALLATLFDFIIEPVAVKLGYWQWLDDGNIPFYNYACWFGVSLLLLTVFKRLPFDKTNRLAVHLFFIQVLFFLLLRLFL